MKGQEIISQKELLKELDLLWFKKEEERKKKNKEICLKIFEELLLRS